MTAPQFTPGPWEFRVYSGGCTIVSQHLEPGRSIRARLKGVKVSVDADVMDDQSNAAEASPDARLIAAAPDHADIGWTMCVAAGRWEPWQHDGRGEFVLNGIRFATKLDPFGMPEVTPALRAQIAKARGDA